MSGSGREARERRAVTALLAGMLLIPPAALASAQAIRRLVTVRERARRATCKSGLRQIRPAILVYQDDHGEIFPAEGADYDR